MPPDKAKDTPSFAEEGMSTSELAAEVRDLRNALAASRAAMPLSTTPLHGAGPADEVAETWSQAEQEAAKAE
jgi:hypothetical protein